MKFNDHLLYNAIHFLTVTCMNTYSPPSAPTPPPRPTHTPFPFRPLLPPPPLFEGLHVCTEYV